MTANTYGRQVVIPLTNKSGGGVIAGDVVVIDTTNSDAFTTSTAGAVTITIGVAQATIASNAAGPVLISGYAALVNVNASVTRGNYGKTYTVAKQATDAGAARVTGTFCQFLTGGTTPDAMVYPVDLAGVALTNPMTHAQALIVGGTAGAPTELVVGAAGGALSVINATVSWNSGTSMPGSKATGDRYWRTDLFSGIEATWDGTRWLGPIMVESIPIADALLPDSAAGNVATHRGVLWNGDFDIYLLTWYAWTDVLTTNNGTNFYTLALKRDSSSTTIDSFTTAADTASVITSHKRTINALLGTSDVATEILTSKTLSPGGIYSAHKLVYRLVLT